jgi:hypothetical protein
MDTATVAVFGIFTAGSPFNKNESVKGYRIVRVDTAVLSAEFPIILFASKIVKFVRDASHVNREFETFVIFVIFEIFEIFGIWTVDPIVVVCTVLEPNFSKNPTTLFANPFKNPPFVALFTVIDSARFIRGFVNRFFFSFPKYVPMSAANVVFSTRFRITPILF